MVARYMSPLGAFEAHVQGSLAYEGSRTSDLDIDDSAEFGEIPSNTFVDLAFGIENEKYAIELFVANATDEDAPLFFDAECAPGVCGIQEYGVARGRGRSASASDRTSDGRTGLTKGAPRGAPFLFRAPVRPGASESASDSYIP